MPRGGPGKPEGPTQGKRKRNPMDGRVYSWMVA